MGDEIEMTLLTVDSIFSRVMKNGITRMRKRSENILLLNDDIPKFIKLRKIRYWIMGIR